MLARVFLYCAVSALLYSIAINRAFAPQALGWSFLEGFLIAAAFFPVVRWTNAKPLIRFAMIWLVLMVVGVITIASEAAIFITTPVRELLGFGALAKYRRMFGLFTFFYACVHLSMWVGVDWFFDWRSMGGEIVKHKYILIGMTTFVLLLPLALTSTNASVRRLGGARWARLHRLVYLCAITGTVHYLWAVKKDTLFPLMYLAVFVALLGFRVWEHYIGPLRLRKRPARRTVARRALPLSGATTPSSRPLGDAK